MSALSLPHHTRTDVAIGRAVTSAEPITDIDTRNHIERTNEVNGRKCRTGKLALKTSTLLNLEGATVVDVGVKQRHPLLSAGALRRSLREGCRLRTAARNAPLYRGSEEAFLFNNIEAVEAALSDDHGTAQLTRQGIGNGNASLCLERGAVGDETISIRLAPLDQFCVSESQFHQMRRRRARASALSRSTRDRDKPSCRPIRKPCCERGRSLFFFEGLGYRGVMYLDSQYLPYQTGWPSKSLPGSPNKGLTNWVRSGKSEQRVSVSAPDPRGILQIHASPKNGVG